jgi:hypothetical protein
MTNENEIDVEVETTKKAQTAEPMTRDQIEKLKLAFENFREAGFRLSEAWEEINDGTLFTVEYPKELPSFDDAVLSFASWCMASRDTLDKIKERHASCKHARVDEYAPMHAVMTGKVCLDCGKITTDGA